MTEREPLNYSGIFFDSANLGQFKKWLNAHILGGASTNPLIFQKEGIVNIPEHISKMVKISGPGFPISIEIPDSRITKAEMIKLALKYREKFPDNAVIKVPMDPRNPQKAFEVAYQLGQEGVRVNATLGLSTGQLVGAAEALRASKAQGDNYISLFWSRRGEAKQQIVEEMEKNGVDKRIAQDQVPDAVAVLAMTLKYLETHSLQTRVIIGSIRSLDQIESAFANGADIVAIPPKLIEEWMYTQRGVETTKEFNQAFRGVQDKTTLI